MEYIMENIRPISNFILNTINCILLINVFNLDENSVNTVEALPAIVANVSFVLPMLEIIVDRVEANDPITL